MSDLYFAINSSIFEISSLNSLSELANKDDSFEEKTIRSFILGFIFVCKKYLKID